MKNLLKNLLFLNEFQIFIVQLTKTKKLDQSEIFYEKM